ncbi:MAG TPA: hypothetical protein VMD91_12710 [Candidatus Sulfotelmatobacter sp.]|nr:hypothetical protein [Candidatus Sulfotelmatobacter sp.]
MRLIAPTIAALGLFATSAAADTPAVNPVDVRLRVVFLPYGTASDTSATTQAIRTGITKLVDSINQQNPLYNACNQAPGAAVDGAACDATQANLIVTTAWQSGAAGASITLSPVDLPDHQSFAPVVLTVTPGTDDPGDANAIAAALQLNATQIQALLGTPTIANGLLSTAAYQPYVQLVPDVGSSQATHVDLLQNLLARRGIASVASQFNAGTVTSGKVSAQTICGLGQRYLVYSYAERTEDRILSLNTRVETRMTGHLYDCPTRTDLPFGNDTHTFATNTALSFGPFINLLAVLFLSKTGSWTYTAAAGGLASKIVDQTPAQIEDHTVEITMQQFVDHFCDKLHDLPTLAPATIATPVPMVTATPTPSPTPTPPPPGSAKSYRVLTSNVQPQNQTTGAGATTAGSGASTATASAAQSLDIGQFTATTPPPLKCGKPIYEDPPPIPADAPLFTRRDTRS